jgi:hypothetical protein
MILIEFEILDEEGCGTNNESGAKIYVFYREHPIFVVGPQLLSDE